MRLLGFDGPFVGGRHHFVVYGTYRLPILSYAEYSVAQLHILLREVENILGRSLTLEEWQGL